MVTSCPPSCPQTPVSASVVVKSLSTVKRVKTSARNQIQTSTTEELIRIELETPPTEEYDVTPAVEKWAIIMERRPNQKNRKVYQRKIMVASYSPDNVHV